MIVCYDPGHSSFARSESDSKVVFYCPLSYSYGGTDAPPVRSHGLWGYANRHNGKPSDGYQSNLPGVSPGAAPALK